MAKKFAKTAPDPTPDPAANQSTTTPTAPDHATAYHHFMLARRYKELAGFYNRPEYIDRAVSEYKLAIAADPASLFPAGRTARALLALRPHRPSIWQEVEGVLKVDPDYPDAPPLAFAHLLSQSRFHARKTTAAAKENLAKAIEYLEALVRVLPSDTDSLLLLGRLYRANNQSAKAEEIFRKVLQADPDSAVGLANLAELYIQQNAFDQAIDVLSKIPEGDMTSQLFWHARLRVLANPAVRESHRQSMRRRLGAGCR